MRVVHDDARVVLGNALVDGERAGRGSRTTAFDPSAPKRSGWPCSMRMTQSSRVSASLTMSNAPSLKMLQFW